MSPYAVRSGLRPISISGLPQELPSQGCPHEMVEIIEVANGQRVRVRPILPADAASFQSFVSNLPDASRRNRFLHPLRELPRQVLQRLVRIDYRTHMALVAEVMRDGMLVIIAEARYAVDRESDSAELAAAVADDWQGLGLAKALLRRLAAHAAAVGIKRLTGETLASNASVLHLAREAGFSIMPVSGVGGLFWLSRNVAQSPLPAAARPASARLHALEGLDG